jgi:hypothetical protein
MPERRKIGDDLSGASAAGRQPIPVIFPTKPAPSQQALYEKSIPYPVSVVHLPAKKRRTGGII